MNRHKIFIISIAFLVLALGTFAFIQERIIDSGTQVILKTRPVDPRDLLRGEYVVLRYEIEEDLLVQQKIAESSPQNGSPIYIKLAANDIGFVTVTDVKTTVPDLSSGLWIKGEVSDYRARFPQLEQYFVPEGAGRPIESIRNDMYVQVRILDGEARIVNLLDKDLKVINPYEYREAE